MAFVTSTARYFRPRPRFGAKVGAMELTGDPGRGSLISFMKCAGGLTFFDAFSKSKLPVGARVGLDLIPISHRRPWQGDDNGTGK
jgi:hypothetical protein